MINENDGVQFRINRSIAKTEADKRLKGLKHEDPSVYGALWNNTYHNVLNYLETTKNYDWLV